MDKERKIVTMHENYEDRTYVVSLNSDQINLLNYLSKNDLLNQDVEWNINDKIEEI